MATLATTSVSRWCFPLGVPTSPGHCTYLLSAYPGSDPSGIKLSLPPVRVSLQKDVSPSLASGSRLPTH